MRSPLNQQAPTRSNFYRTQSQNRFTPYANNGTDIVTTNPANPTSVTVEKETPDAPTSEVNTDETSTTEAVAPVCESTLVRNYMDLDEQKDESICIQTTDMGNMTSLAAQGDEKSVLDEFLNAHFNPFVYEVKPSEQLRATRMPTLTKYEAFLSQSVTLVLDQVRVDAYSNSDTLSKLVSGGYSSLSLLDVVDLKLLDALLGDLESGENVKAFGLFEALRQKSDKFLEALISFVLATLRAEFFQVSCCGMAPLEVNKENQSCANKITTDRHRY